MSYDEVQREDMDLLQRILDRTCDHRVPIPPTIKSGLTLLGASDNFDKNDNKGGSHDTILMFFQNPSQVPGEYLMIRPKRKDTVRNRKLVTELPCQKIIESNRGLFRGSIPISFVAGKEPDPEASSDDYTIWSIVRYIANDKIDLENGTEKAVPSFSTMSSILSKETVVPTSIAFAPILPFPATDFDCIHTCLINFQDALLQKKLPYGAFWCDENVFRIAKELF